ARYGVLCGAASRPWRARIPRVTLGLWRGSRPAAGGGAILTTCSDRQREVHSARPKPVSPRAASHSWGGRRSCILAGVQPHCFDSIQGRPEEEAMPKKDAAPKRGAPRSKAVMAKGARGARKSAPGEDAFEPDEMLDVEPEATARKPAARRARGARKLAVVPKPEVEDEDSIADVADEAPVKRTAGPKAASARLVQLLNDSLGWELRAQAMYAHYAAYVKGLESLTLAEHFEAEVTESLG